MSLLTFFAPMTKGNGKKKNAQCNKIINAQRNIQCNKVNKCSNKAQHNNKCKPPVSRTVVDWKMFTFRLGSHVSLLFFFLFELFEIRIVVRGPNHFHLEFSLRKPNCSNFETFENRGLTLDCNFLTARLC